MSALMARESSTFLVPLFHRIQIQAQQKIGGEEGQRGSMGAGAWDATAGVRAAVGASDAVGHGGRAVPETQTGSEWSVDAAVRREAMAWARRPAGQKHVATASSSHEVISNYQRIDAYCSLGRLRQVS
ncbi:hypothetical protein BRADI_1g26382v3 [Brachypodium distachyon]|uniref:Uncharacterized protein n=1 Tax=Brachypodium distachyon TaxID=15368 RepID=A0A0Q3H033_BRADI|nr:hypothetical protein BRADI_1g26382v3 [Brachypodium distachyon]KQK16029.1 hypothetical protein BRADI_1g26382v3 [Brachypodium distachyon]KQK16030.1 hypothetical protein BRADI_1g26382v3 [Brachypodium distachyon]KQK16031.1 hypothetical protein BRADI_1g26382v3 [Brachypodium distachyon]